MDPVLNSTVHSIAQAQSGFSDVNCQAKNVKPKTIYVMHMFITALCRGASAQEVERLTRVSSQFWLSWDRAIALPLFTLTLFPWGQPKFRPY